MTASRDKLIEHVLGLLPEDEQRALETELAASPALALELAQVREALGVLPASLAPAPAPASGRARLLAALDSGARFTPFADDLARYFDLSRARVLELLQLSDERAQWSPGPMPGIELMHFPGGPRALAPDTGFVRFVKGFRFPQHRHLGPELNYVLSGSVIDGDGRAYIPGEALVMSAGSAHAFSIDERSDTLIAVAQVGFELLLG